MVQATMTNNREAAMQENAEAAAELMKQLSNPNRLMILCAIATKTLSVSDINRRVSISQSALSQHLTRLRKAGLVKTRKDRQTVYYSLQGDAAIQVISVLERIYCPDA